VDFPVPRFSTQNFELGNSNSVSAGGVDFPKSTFFYRPIGVFILLIQVVLNESKEITEIETQSTNSIPAD